MSRMSTLPRKFDRQDCHARVGVPHAAATAGSGCREVSIPRIGVFLSRDASFTQSMAARAESIFLSYS
jgi:hypothetical protein